MRVDALEILCAAFGPSEPDDVRVYIGYDGSCVTIAQGSDMIAFPIEEWEQFCAEGMGALMRLRAEREEVRGG